jgi:hypothetical protein
MTPYAWFYLNSGKKQHVVRLADMDLRPMQSAICGCQVLAVLPPQAKWHSDQEGLDARGKCKQCTAILERETNV